MPRRTERLEVSDTREVESDLLNQRAADALDDVAFDLIAQPIRIDDEAAVVSNDHPSHPHVARLGGHFDLDVCCHVAITALRRVTQRFVSAGGRSRAVAGQRDENLPDGPSTRR